MHFSHKDSVIILKMDAIWTSPFFYYYYYITYRSRNFFLLWKIFFLWTPKAQWAKGYHFDKKGCFFHFTLGFFASKNAWISLISSFRQIVLVIEKNFWIQGWRPRLCKNFEITNSERSEQCLIIECFFNLLLEVSYIWWIRTIRIQIGKNYWDLETCRKS